MIKRQKKFFIFFGLYGRALHSLGAKLRISTDSYPMKKQEISRFMPKNMFANFRSHLIVPFVKFVIYMPAFQLSFGNIEAAHPIETHNMLRFNGFETTAPYKGNVSANRMQSDKSWL